MIAAEDLAHRLGLKQYPRSWRGDCPACNYRGAFAASNGKRGTRLWCANGCSQEQLVEAVNRIAGGSWEPPPGQTDPSKGAETSKRKQAAALKLWTGAAPLAGSPAELYLRGRDLPGLISSPALRYRPDCPHPERWKVPALIALVTGADGQPVGCHRTYIDYWGGKAKVEPPKASLGPVWGGAIRLDPIAPEIVVGEGVESSASAGRLLNLPAWAALSAGNLAIGLILPPEIRRVVIAADHDPPTNKGNRPGQDAARSAWFRWRGEGREARIFAPDKEGSDFNDVLRVRIAREAAHA
jgi:putative DNA primase/helicase